MSTNSKIIGRLIDNSKDSIKHQYSFDDDENEFSHDTTNWQLVHKNP